MKIAIIYDVIYPYVKGGAEKRIFEISRRLAARGHEVHLFGMKFWAGDSVFVSNGVTLHGVCRGQRLYFNSRRTISEALIFGLALFPPLIKNRFDLIDCQQFPYFSCFTARFVSLIRRTPLLITWIEVWGESWYDYLGVMGAFGKAMERTLASFRVPTITISPATADRFGTVFHKMAPPVIMLGVDIQHIERISPSPESTDVIFVGRLIKEKHADLLIKAFKLVTLDHPEVRLTIIGDGPEKDDLNILIQNSSLENQVTMHGFFENNDDVIARLKSSAVFVLPSTREGFGLAALEALACGIPVVTIDHPSNAIRNLISDSNGYLSSFSSDDLSKKIQLALDNHEKMRASCIASAVPYDWDTIVSQLEHMYFSLQFGEGFRGDGKGKPGINQ